MVAAVILAAGGGSRFHGKSHKLEARFRGRPVISWVFDAVEQAGFDEVYVVVGAVALDDLVPAGVTVLSNPNWADGQSTSLAVAVDAVDSDEHDAFVVGLGDQPLVPTSAWRSVGAAAGTIVTATFDGKRRPPVKLMRSVWSELPRTGDSGARDLMQRRPELVSEIPCRGNPIDIDTVEDLQIWS